MLPGLDRTFVRRGGSADGHNVAANSREAIHGHSPQAEGSVMKHCSVAFDANIAYRAYMEDAAVVVDPFLLPSEAPGGETWAFYAVYDGHGGRAAVDVVEARLHDILLDELRSASCSFVSEKGSRQGASPPLSDEAVAEALSRSFQRIDEQLKNSDTRRCGCTATVTLVRRTPAAVRLHVANVGDSRCIVIDGSGAERRLSRDHRPTDAAEARRVEAEGGFVTRGRVAGQLAVSRALGDHALKSIGVSWRPHVAPRDATRDRALVLASDGLWDAMGDADVRRILEQAEAVGARDQAAQMLVRGAKQRGSMDNITALVAYFDTSPDVGGDM